MAYEETNTTARQRELGDELRRARLRAGIKAADLAERLGWSTTRISRVEHGKTCCSEADAAMYLGHCGVGGKEIKRLLVLCDGDEDGAWLQAFGNRTPERLQTLNIHERTASQIYSVENHVVPGLLQTEDYARALLRGYGFIPEPVIGVRVDARMARRSVYTKVNPPNIVFYIDQRAFEVVVGGPQVMYEQMLHLLFMASQVNCVIRVVPTVRPHAGTIDAFQLIQSDEYPPIVYLEMLNRILTLESPTDIASYWLVLNTLADVALSAEESRSVLADLVSRYDRSGTGDGERGHMA